MPDNSVDSIVTDPPYELGFMGKKWDSTGIAYDQTLWAECLRVLKPGGHLIAFGGTRTYHRMTCAIEDAGFEIRDCIQWIYGSGFPKSHDVSKAMDKVTGTQSQGFVSAGHDGRKAEMKQNLQFRSDYGYKYEPATPAAQQWHGFGTALKPANEPAVLARKPLSGTVADNVLTWGVGALNIDGCRVEYDGKPPTGSGSDNNLVYGHRKGNGGNETSPLGRWPANVIFDEEAAQMLDAQSGVSKSNVRPPTGKGILDTAAGWNQNSMTDTTHRGHADSGGASRFFYVAKSSRTEREAGLNAPQGERGNHHPTVKPITLMQYLVRLVTPPNGTVLDPFMGSGSTGCAAMLEAMSFVGIELNQEYVEIARRRILHHANQNPLGL
jgi:site-specific DNA-methyltransferase (adenine-specific)